MIVVSIALTARYRARQSKMHSLAVVEPVPTAQVKNDWASGKLSFPLIWISPKLAIVAAAFASLPIRTTVWSVALVWMGMACILNSHRCGRVHCRYTGPYYLLLTLPVLFFGAGMAELGVLGWVILGSLAVLGGTAITWITERSWGKYEGR